MQLGRGIQTPGKAGRLGENGAAVSGQKGSRCDIGRFVMKKIAILGSTGSIGTQTLDIVRSNKNDFNIVGLSAGHNLVLLEKQD